MERKWKLLYSSRDDIGVTLRLHGDKGKEHRNYCLGFGAQGLGVQGYIGFKI